MLLLLNGSLHRSNALLKPRDQVLVVFGHLRLWMRRHGEAPTVSVAGD
jgi:hypothetical protein